MPPVVASDALIPTIIFALVCALGWLGLSTIKRATAAEQAAREQLEREQGAHRERLSAQITNLTTRVGTLERRERVLEDYCGALRSHIEQRHGPPPPEWPRELND